MIYHKYIQGLITEYTIFLIADLVALGLLAVSEFHLVRIFCLDVKNQVQDIKVFLFHAIAMAVVTIFILILGFFSVRLVLDIPYIVKKDFCIMEGIVVSQDSAGNERLFESRTVKLKNLKTSEENTFYFYYTPIKFGETYEVIYLPNTKIGYILKK